ncbi:hypothetical protein KR074_008384 [Drosophila pseudoananassae]|nr:hypothetical protein KR074_008384 [Drosophila pseudoananassae]
MQQNIWSSPQVGGSGGALKALARNVANHLKLNRSAMKRVVAQVVAEHHSLGEVADYKGHMYFAKPDRLNFTELIAQSKEAFDDLLLHEPRLANRIQSRPMGNPKPKFQPVKSPPRQRASVKPAPSRILKMPQKPQLPISKNPPPPPPRKQRVPSPKKQRSRSALKHHPKNSSTTEFQLDDAGTVRSLNGVIIEDNHLPQDGENREILLHVPQAAKKPRRRGRRTIKLHESQEDLRKAPLVVAAPKPALPRPAPAPPASANQGSARRVLSRRSQRQLNAGGRRLVAGGAPSPLPKGGPTQQKQLAPGKKPAIKKKFTACPRYRKKPLPLLQRTYEKPWLVRRRRKRLSGGCQKPAPGKTEATANVPEKEPEPLDKMNVEWVEKNSDKDQKSDHSVKKKEEPKIQRPPARPRQEQSHVARQMRNVSFPWYTPYQFQGGTGTPGRAAMKAGVSNHRLNLQRSRRNMPGTPIPPLKRKLNITKRQRHHRRMQDQLLRELQREEAIDEPHSNGSGIFRQRRVWQQPDPQGQQKGATNSAPTNSKAASPDRRSLERVSSRVKRFRQPAPSPVRATGGGLRGAGGKVGAVGSPRRSRRNRYVPVGSSLGSIAALAVGQPQDSKHSLTPAKRHLTIAFMNKRDDRSHHRQPQPHWK